MRSARVDLPWSICAMTQKLRISSGGVNVLSANVVTQQSSGVIRNHVMVARGLEVLRAARQRAFTAITSSEHRDVSLDMWRRCDPTIQSDERDAELLRQRYR